MKTPRRKPHPQQRQRAIGTVLGLAAIAVVATWMALQRNWTNENHETSTTPAQVEDLPLPELADSPFRDAMQAAEYVGSQACGQCHGDQHASYLESAHSRSFAVVDLASEPADGEFARGATAWRYKSSRIGGELRHREFLLTPQGEIPLVDRPLKYLVGSGRFSRTYLADMDGILVESPLTWFASLQAWDFSPGFEEGPFSSFCRNISADCLYCHVGRAEFLGQSENRAKFHELSIGCERCHGPGSIHVAERRGGKEIAKGHDHSIVHPQHLSRELAEAICHQCHLESGAFALVRGRRREEFRPGLRWTDFVVNYAPEVADSGMTVTGHVQQMHMSRCYKASDTLTCITCHDPHATPSPAERPTYYRNVCLQCHDDGACRIAPIERAAKNQNHCAACHMPQSPTDIPHIAFTHHRIGIHRHEPVAPIDEQPHALIPVLDASHLPEADRQRVLGLAYSRMLAEHSDDARYQAFGPLAEELLERAAAQGARDPAVQTALALLAKARGDVASARAGAEAALARSDILPFDRTAATHLLAILDLRDNRFEAARARFEQLVQWQHKAADWFLLGTCRQQLGDEDGAIAAFERVIQIDANEPGAYRTLAPLYRARGENEKAERALATAIALEEQLARLTN